MAKLINEAQLDDDFNTQMKKIQGAVKQLMELTVKIKEPLVSQLSALKQAERDLHEIADQMSKRRT